MFGRLTIAGCIEPRLLEREIPLCWAVGVVDEHQGRIVLETLGLLDHGYLVLLDEALAEELRNGCDEGDSVEDVPCGVDIDAAGVGYGWRHSRDAGKPLIAATDGFVAAIR